MDEDELEPLLLLDGATFEMAPGIVVEFAVRRTDMTDARPHGISYALVLRAKGAGAPWVRFDNAHATAERRGGNRRKGSAFDHWHRGPGDRGRPYRFTTALRLLEDFWREVKRTLDEKGVPNDL